MNLNKLQPYRLYILLLSRTIWILEELFFYPKLSRSYSEVLQTGILEQKEANSDLIIFDVGANQGQSVKFFKEIFDKTLIYCFEPQPNTFKLLENTILNRKYEKSSHLTRD